MKKMLAVGLLFPCLISLISQGGAGDQSSVNSPVAWQDVYVVNNTDYDLEVGADVTDIPHINNVNVQHIKNPIHRTSWLVPKRQSAHNDGMVKLDTLNRLHNLNIQVVVPNISVLPEWLQKPYPIPITDRQKSQILVIYIGKTAERWLITQRYVDGVRIDSQRHGPSGYTVQVDQP